MTSKEQILNTIRSNKAKISRLGIKDIGLFGSYVRNEPSHTSDIDILIDFEPGRETFDNYMAVYDMIEKLFRNYRIEIVTRNGLSPYIGPKILSEVQYV